MHARFHPKRHRFSYRIFMLAVDLDELPAVHRRLRLFSVNRANLYAFRESDHLPITEPLHAPTPQTKSNLLGYSPPASGAPHDPSPPAKSNPIGYSLPSVAFTPPIPPARSTSPTSHPSASLKARVLAFLAARDVHLGPRGRVELVTLPRIFGYLFNPVSFFFCYDSTGACVASLAEVTNTFREVKPYFLGPENLRPRASENAAASFHLRTPKHFYVSPFSDVDVAFDFNLRAPTEKLSIQIDDYAGTQRTLTSTLAGPARPLTDARLAWFTLKYPLLTLRVIALIHWHALRLYLRKFPWFPKAARASDQRDLYRPHASLSRPQPEVPVP